MSICKDKTCPWMGKSCPGEDECAPAVLAAHGKTDEGGNQVAPYCPLVIAIDCLCAMGMRAEQAMHKEVSDKVVDGALGKDSIRAKVLAGLAMDQE